MFNSNQYGLIDFGDGRKLERFGAQLLDRPCPAAEGLHCSRRSAWSSADARYERNAGERGAWAQSDSLPECWTISHGPAVLELKPTEFGHVGVFPEQAENWDWLARRTEGADRPVRVLNLFAYTGGSTLAIAAAGGEVAHIDSAKNTIGRARRNAELSGLAEAPIRWIAEDAAKFAAREARRGNRYDAIVLDPPSYGHGPKGEVWKFDEHFAGLLDLCAELTEGAPAFLLATCHSPGFEQRDLRAALRAAFPRVDSAQIETGDLALTTSANRRLPAGIVARWTA
jgi:23S rRNA (cytosine1962-C5)-methyltransferase